MATEGRVTQDAIETLSLPNTAGRVTQGVVETLILPPAVGRVTQAVLELLGTTAAVVGGERVQTYVWGPL